MSNSIVSNDKICIICGCGEVHKHHLEIGPNRKLAEEDGLWIYLCPKHHNMSDESVHLNSIAMKWARRFGEMAWINHFCPGEDIEIAKEKFRKRYGHNYL